MGKWWFLLLLFPTLSLSAEPLRAVVSQTNTAPYAIFDQQQRLSDGIAKELLDALSARLNKSVEYLDLPRGRVVEWLMTVVF
jgi:polar amino acid transport system substrate-binding protein